MKIATRLENFFPAIILLFLGVVLLAISTTAPMGNDEGMWSYMGRIWIENEMPPYAHSVENKTPGIFTLHAISYKFFGIAYMPVRILGVISILVSSFLLFRIASHLHNRFAGLLSMLIFGLSMAWGSMDGIYTGQTETFMIMFSIAGIFALLQNIHTNQKKWLLLCGLFLGFAIAFKQVAIVTCIPIFFFLLFFENKKKFRSFNFQSAFLLFIGILLATTISILPLLFSGVEIKEYIDGAWLILLQKASTVPKEQHIANFLTAWTGSRITWFIPFLFSIAYFLFQKRNRIYNLLGLILLFDFIAVNLSGNYYGHQFKQLLPSLSLLTALSIAHLVSFKINKKEKTLKVCLLLFVGFYFYPFWQSLHPPKKKDPAKTMAKWIKNHTAPKAYIYTPNYHYNSILSYSERRSSSNYFNFIFVQNQEKMNDVLKDLRQNPPALIIGKMHESNTYERMKNYMRKNYKKIKTMHGIDIFEKNKRQKNLDELKIENPQNQY